MPLQRKVSGVPFTRGKMLKGPPRRQGERKPRSFGARVTTCRILKVRDGLCYEKCFLGGKKGLKSERWGPLPGRRQVGRGWYPSLPGLCCYLAVVPGCWRQQPLPPGAVSELSASSTSLPFLPICLPPTRAAGHRRLRRGLPLNFVNDGERGEQSGEVEGRQPWRGTR